MEGIPHDSMRRRVVMGSAGMAGVLALPACQSTGGGGGGGVAPRARFAYAGAYTVRAPGGRSARADAAPATGISVFGVAGDTGALTRSQVVAATNPAHLALNRAQTRLYAINEVADYAGRKDAGSVEAYAIDDASGRLTLINRQAIGPIPAHFSIDPSGRYVVIATYVGGGFQLLPILPDGSLGTVISELKQSGSGPHQRQQSPHPHMALFDPSGRHVVTTDLGLDRIETLRIDGGQLQRVSAVSITPGSGPRHLAFGSNGRIVYVINELSATIMVFGFDPASGRLGPAIQTVATVPADFPAHKSTAAILVHPSGRYLYGTNRKFENHPLADSIVGYRIDESSGRLQLIGHTTTGAAFPRTMNFDPTGTWLYVLNQKGDTIVQFAIDQATGDLTATGRVTDAVTPAGLVFRT